MILTIISLSILVLVIVGIILDKIFLDNEIIFYFSIGGIIIGGILSVGFGTVALINNCSYICKQERIRYETKVMELQTTYNYLSYLDNDKDKYTAIQQYNTEVSEFKTKILTAQQELKNPWINWLQCKEYKYFDANVVSYIGASYEIH